jgi:AraC-like DNA-binding protein
LDEENFAPFVLSFTNNEQILNAYKAAEKAWRSAQNDREYKVLSELYKILHEMSHAKALPYLPETKQALIQPALDYIHKNYTKELINAQNLAELCGISYDYLRQLFEKFYGLTPIKYINALKLTRAKELLDSGMYSVSEAAYHSGFSDVSHFSRFFKASVGVLPSEYRN